jgi:Na+/H+-dicarboxylate symporter
MYFLCADHHCAAHWPRGRDCRPGAGFNIDPPIDPTVAAGFAKQAAPQGFVQFVLHIIPNAFFGAFAEGEVLPVLLIAIICGFGLTRIGVAGKPVLEGINSFAHMLFAAFGLIMKLAPLGAFGAMALRVIVTLEPPPSTPWFP